MTTTLEIPDEALSEVRAKFVREKTPEGTIPVMVSLRNSPDGSASSHFLAFMRLPAPEPVKPLRRKSTKIKREKSDPPWYGLAVPFIHVEPGMSHDWSDIQKSIEDGIADEMAEKERRIWESSK